jgi:hypothetical protein
MPNLNSFTRASVGVVTTDATQTIAATFDTSPWGNTGSFAFDIFIHVLGRQTNGVGEAGSYYRVATFARVDGVLSQIGNTTVVASPDRESVAGWDVTIDKGSQTVVGTTTGDFIRVLVTGASGDTVKWIVNHFDLQTNGNAPISD